MIEKAMAEMQESAELMHERGQAAYDIWRSIVRQAALWRQLNANIPDGTALSIVRSLPGMDGYDPDLGLTDVDLAVGIDASLGCDERWRRAYVLAAWLEKHAGSMSAELAVLAVTRDIVERSGGIANDGRVRRPA